MSAKREPVAYQLNYTLDNTVLHVHKQHSSHIYFKLRVHMQQYQCVTRQKMYMHLLLLFK
jgi:hypothetical protein